MSLVSCVPAVLVETNQKKVQCLHYYYYMYLYFSYELQIKGGFFYAEHARICGQLSRRKDLYFWFIQAGCAY